MNARLADVAVLRVVFALNFAHYYHMYSTLPGGASGGDGPLRWFSSGVSQPYFNGVIGEGDGSALAPRMVAQPIAYFTRLRLPFLWHCPPDSAAGYEATLRSHGLQPFTDEPGMALDLTTLPRHDARLPGLTIERVAGQAALEAWTAVWMDGVPEPARRHCRAVYHGLGPHVGAYFLGRLEGVPVATVKLFAAAGVVSVQHVMTVPQARRRGIGLALVSHALRQAREWGYHVAVLTTTPAGLGLYTRLGFRAFCRYKCLLWVPDGPALDG